MKRILAFVVVLSVLLSVCSISAAASPLYSVEADTNAVTPFALTALNAAVAADTGSTLINGDSSYWSTWSSYLAGYLSYAGFSVAESVFRSMNSLNSSVTSLSNIDLLAGAIRTDVASILNDMGAITSAIQTVITAIETNTSALNVNPGDFLGSGGNVSTSTSKISVSNIIRSGFLGLSSNIGSFRTSFESLLNVNPGDFLGSGGNISTSTSKISASNIIRSGFLGLRYVITGGDADNVYSLKLWDNNNNSVDSNVGGFIPLLNTHLNWLGENLGHLAFMFASDDDISLKADSQPVLDEVTDTVFGTGSGKVKLDVSNVSDLTGMSDDVLGYFETGGQLGDINTVVNDDSTWLWFTAQTAADLDTTGSSLSLTYDETDYCIDSHTKWYSLFYRDVLGRDYVGG